MGMDIVLLAVTALGAMGLYLMLPRERAPLARLGGLLGAMALGALFLFLARLVHRAGGGGPPVYFYLFAAIMIAGAIGVICQPRPVYAALYFVMVTLAGAGMFVLLLAEFMAIVLVIIYAGAILVTYVFVIMLASQASAGGEVAAPVYDLRATGGLAAVCIAFVMIGTVLQALLPEDGAGLSRPIAVSTSDKLDPNNRPRLLMAQSLGLLTEQPATAQEPITRPSNTPDEDLPPHAVASNVQVLGSSLYSHHAISLELAGILLTIALIGAVVIARKNAQAVRPASDVGKRPAD